MYHLCMKLIVNNIPPEYLALRINYCKQQIRQLPDVRMHTYNIHGVETKTAVFGKHRYAVSTPRGRELACVMEQKEYYRRQLNIYESIWANNYKYELPSECTPRKVQRLLYVAPGQPVIMDKHFFDSLKNDANKRYPKPKDYHFGGIDYRSAAERDIAVCYTEMGIPFKYEPEVYINGLAEPIFPDFVLYITELDNCKIHEHFGVKSVAAYLKTTKFKYCDYANAGLVPELDTIYTYDLNGFPFDIRTLPFKLNTSVYLTMLSSQGTESSS